MHPQEVARHLSTHPQVATAHVRAESDGEEARLVAYVVPADPHAVPTAGSLRAHLAEVLPAGHIPGGYVVIDALPLLPGGKVDAGALPRPRLWHRAGDVPYRRPGTETGRALAELWSEVLRVERVGADDSFFDLGGHSLAAVRIANRIRSRWAVEVSVHDLLERPTVAGLAGLVDAGGTGRTAALPPIEHGEDDDRVPLTAQQQQVWFLDQLAPGNIAYHAQTTIRVVGELDADALQRAVDAITARQSIFRTTFHDDGGTPFQRVHAQGRTPVGRVDISGLPQAGRRARVEELAAMEMTTPFDLGELPLVRWTVVRLGPDEHEIILVEHHLVHDGLVVRAADAGVARRVHRRGHRGAQLSSGARVPVHRLCPPAAARTGGACHAADAGPLGAGARGRSCPGDAALLADPLRAAGLRGRDGAP
ncbi:hypothetical protein GXW82_01010 [Streptacidiphilus sp. 4-A2]|nr:hypothetical protein [Streptacidiphilus sp. 4-A2]